MAGFRIEGNTSGNVAEVTVANAIKVDASATTQPVSIAGTLPVTGSVTVSNFPATQPVSGTVAVSTLPALPAGSNAIGSVSVSNLPATQAISAASLPLPSGAATSAKQPALGTAGTPSTDVITVQGIASGTPQPVSGTVAVSTLPALPAGANAIGSVSVSNFPATQPVSGTVAVSTLPALPAGSNAIGSVSVSNFPATQAISAASLPLPTGAALDTSVNGVLVSQGSTTSGEKGPLVQGAVTTAAPTYTTAQTSPLSLNTAGGLRVDPSGVTAPIGVTSPSQSAAGVYALVDPGQNSLNVSLTPSTIFIDTFDGSTLDTTVRWTATSVGAGAINVNGGACSLAPGTAASAAQAIASQAAIPPQFTPQTVGCSLTMDTTVTATHRFFGVGTVPGSWTALTPLQDAIGFEIDTSGNLNCVIYNAGTRTFSQNITTGQVNYKNGLAHRYAVSIREDIIIWYVDAFSLPVATSTFLTPANSTLPIRAHVINPTTTVGYTPVFTFGGIGMGDDGQNSKTLSDGLYPWRKATISATGALKVDNSAVTQPISGSVSISGTPAVTISGTPTVTATISGTPSVSISGTPAVTATDNLTQIGGSSVATAASGVLKVGVVGSAGATVDAAITSGAAPTNVVWQTPCPSTQAAAALLGKTLSSVNAATNIKASAGNLYGFTLTSATATAGYIQFFNTATTATASPVLIVPIVASGIVTIPPGMFALLNFSNGIAINVATTVGGTTEITVTGTIFYV